MNGPVNRTSSASLTLLFLLVCLGLPSRARADEAKPDAAPAPAPAKAGGEPKKDAAPAKNDAKTDAKSAEEDEKAKLLALFKSEKPITNTLGNVFEYMPAGYRVSRYEVTQGDFEQVMKTNPSKFKGGMHPVENVTWEEANDYCKKLTEKEQKAGKLPKGYSYTLPTEAQWEFYVDDATLKDAITSLLGDRKNTENVGALGPNKYGLHDVRGNVWEWCSTPVARGGSWRTFEDWLAISFRYAGTPGTRYDDIGFRCVLMGP